MKYLKPKQSAKQVLTFRKWKRKGYSAFQTMRREVVIAVLATSYLYSVPLVGGASEQDTTVVKMEYNLDEIEVSAQRTPALYSQVARIVAVVERSEIESSPARSVEQLLEYVAGVDIRQRGTEGVQADVSIRGGTFDQTLILLNGINITDPQTGHHNLNLPVSLQNIERIEILEGPAARVYGPNAFSGAINIITRKPENNSVEIAATIGSYKFLDAGLAGSFKTGRLGNGISVNGKSSDGYIDNTDFEMRNLFYAGQLETNSGDLIIQLGASEKGFGANSFYTPKYPNQYEETKTLFSSVKWESNSKLHFTPAVYWRKHNDRFELFRSNPASWYKSHNYHLTQTYGTNVNFWIQTGFGKTAFGAEYRSENIWSNVLGELLDVPVKVNNADAEYTKGKSRNTGSVFLEHSIVNDKWSVTGGFMSNIISGSNLGLNVFPGIDAGFHINSALKLFASYNTSLRMPTFTDLYYTGPTNVGNPDLKPEKSDAFETGLKWNSGLLTGHFVVFHRNGKDIIDWVKKEQGDLWQPQNLTQLKSNGAEFQMKLNFRKTGTKNNSGNFSLNYFYNRLEKQKQNFISNYVLDNLKHKFTVSLNQPIYKNLTFSARLVWQDREGTFTSFENGNWAAEKEYEPFWVADVRLNYSVKKLTAFVSANNIFDAQYNDIGNVVQPGRWVKTGIVYRLNFD